jgi:hypothetical protein
MLRLVCYDPGMAVAQMRISISALGSGNVAPWNSAYENAAGNLRLRDAAPWECYFVGCCALGMLP